MMGQITPMIYSE